MKNIQNRCDFRTFCCFALYQTFAESKQSQDKKNSINRHFFVKQINLPEKASVITLSILNYEMILNHN